MKSALILGLALAAGALAACSDDGLLHSARAGVQQAGRRQCASDPGKNPVTDCLAPSRSGRR